MKNIIKLLLAVLLFASACSGLKVTSDYDKTIDFTKYQTLEYYGWAENSEQLMNRFDKERIENAFGDEFKKRGIEVVPKESEGDLIVTLFIVTEQKTQKTANTTHYGGYGGYYGYGPGWGYGPGYGSSTTTISEYDYVEGTLVCSVYDAKEEKLIWEGVGTKTISENPQKREANIPRAVAAIMAQYPVQPKK